MTVLEVKELTKVYGKGENAVTALNHVSFQVEKGEFVAVIGPSGSGKSTLMNLIGGIDRPTSGSVKIDGKEIYGLNESELAIFRRRNVGIIYQFYNLIENLTAQENIILPCLLDHREPDYDKLGSILNLIGLSERRKHLPSELSGGQQQRVSVGRALINNPAFILADEPTGNLDPDTAWDIMNLLNEINMRGTTVVVATHAKDIVDKMKKRVIHIDKGVIDRDDKKGGYDCEI